MFHSSEVEGLGMPTSRQTDRQLVPGVVECGVGGDDGVGGIWAQVEAEAEAQVEVEIEVRLSEVDGWWWVIGGT